MSTIKVTGGIITNSPMINGNAPVIINGGTSFDWAKIEEELQKVINQLPTNSDEYYESLSLMDIIRQRDKDRFLRAIKKNAKTFGSNLFCSFASSFLVNALKP